MAMNFQDNSAPQQSQNLGEVNLSNQRLVSSRIVSVNPFDILCGRGKTAFTHPGNRRFRDTVASVIDEYNAAGSRLGKSMVVNRIVQGIRAEGGRFLKLDRSSHRYYELDDKQAKEKVGHAIRDASSLINSRKGKKDDLHEVDSTKRGPTPAQVKSSTSSIHSNSSALGDHEKPSPSSAALHRGHDDEEEDSESDKGTSSLLKKTAGNKNDRGQIASKGSHSSPEGGAGQEEHDSFLDHINEVLGPVSHHDTGNGWGDMMKDGKT